jgi:hypothetical protein
LKSPARHRSDRAAELDPDKVAEKQSHGAVGAGCPDKVNWMAQMAWSGRGHTVLPLDHISINQNKGVAARQFGIGSDMILLVNKMLTFMINP